jgi:hypothetical protein
MASFRRLMRFLAPYRLQLIFGLLAGIAHRFQLGLDVVRRGLLVRHGRLQCGQFGGLGAHRAAT